MVRNDDMLFAWLIKEKKFVLFGESDGAIQNEYLSKPRLLSSHGDVYMGGVKGLLHINSNLPPATSELPKLQLSDVIVNGESVNNELCGDPTGISVPWNSNISIRIMSKEEDIFRQKVYRYQIEGLNDQQIESYNPELGHPLASARRLSDYGFLHSKGRQLDSQSADTGTDRTPSLVPHMVVHAGLCLVSNRNDCRNFPENTETKRR